VVVFHGPIQAHLKPAVAIQPDRVRQLLARRNLRLEVTDAARDDQRGMAARAKRAPAQASPR
jgi:hypothetical protein